jgi:hypothetical protein
MAAPAADVAPAPEAAPAAPFTPSTTVSGYVTSGYSMNLTYLKQVGGSAPLNPYNPGGHSFVLHTAHLNVDAKPADGLVVHVGLDAGRDASINASAPLGGGLFDVLEAYGAYSSGIWTLTAGKFTTYEGIEVVQSTLNPTITRGLLYYYAEPVTHTGFKVHAQVSDQINLGLGVVNGWDTIQDNNGMKTFIGRLGWTPSDKAWAALSFTFGSEIPGDNKHNRLSVDLTGAATLSDSFVLNFQGNFGMDPKQSPVKPGKTASWFGLGVQPVYTAGDWSLGGRLEWFDDASGYRLATPVKVSYIDITATPGYKVTDNFKLRLDLGVDIASEKVFPPSGKKLQVLSEVDAEFTF